MDEDPHSEGLHNLRTTWHLCWQAAIGREFFPVEPLYSRVRDRLIHAHGQGTRALVDYCLLPSEIHVIANLTPGEAPGSVARAIGNVVARWVREAEPIRSPVLAGPFRAHHLESRDALRLEVRMLAWRPVALGMCRGPMYHAHGALRAALGKTPAERFDARPLLHAFGATVNDARHALARWVAHRPSEGDWRAWELARGLSRASSRVGPHPYTSQEVRSAQAALLIAGGGDGVDGALQLLERWVAARLGRGVADLHEGVDHTAARGRALVARLALEVGLCSEASVARYFGRAKATLSEQVTASRGRMADAEIVATPIDRILKELRAMDARL